MEVKLNDLPKLPFEKILGYLSLEDRFKCMAVSRRWFKAIDSLRPKSLCFSKRPSDYMHRKNHWVSERFARNFVHSARLHLFCQTLLGHSANLSELKHLRLCEFTLDAGHEKTFAQTLNLFGQLEKLDFIRFDHQNFWVCNRKLIELKLNLPMLHSIQLQEVGRVLRLTLDAPKLKKIKISECCRHVSLDLVPVESVERLIIDKFDYPNVNILKNLKYILLESIQYFYSAWDS